MGFFDGYSVDTEIAIYDPSGNRLTSNDDIDPWSTNPRSAVYLIKCRASTYPYVYVAVGHWDAPLTGGTTGQTISNMDWSAAAPLYAEEGPAPYRNRSPGGAQASQGMRCLDEVPALPGQRGDVEARSCEQPLGPPARGSPSAAACGRDSRRHRRDRFSTSAATRSAIVPPHSKVQLGQRKDLFYAFQSTACRQRLISDNNISMSHQAKLMSKLVLPK